MYDIGFKIKLLRERVHLSQAALSADLDISQTTLSNIENGTTRTVDFVLMDKICRYFNKGFEYFLDSASVHKVKNNNSGAGGHNYGTINNNFPENVLEQVQLLIEENQRLKAELMTLKNKTRFSR